MTDELESLPDPDQTHALDPDRTRVLSNSGRSGPPRFPIPEWDRFEPLAFLGEGGMGRVYKARDRRLNRFVALKFIRGDDEDLLNRFRLEAQSQALIDHPHVCKVYEVGEEAGHCYIAMQFIEGSPLDRAAASMSLEEKLRVMQESAEAIHEAHRLGIIHRDLKPANIMVGRDEHGRWWPYIMDFGLARNLEAQGLTMTGIAMGTPAYMPPEQALGKHSEIDRRSDVYSLGATLYDLLAGVPPFTAPSITDLLWKVVREDPPAPRTHVPGIPAELETIILKCLEKEPDRRYDSARAFADDLRRFLDGEPILARPASLFYRLRKKVKKHRALSVSIFLSAAVGLGFAGWGVSALLRARRQSQLASRFALEVKSIEGTMRIAHMRPLHDLREEKAKVRQRLQRIESEMAALGAIARGPGNHALGLGHQALGEAEAARQSFQSAWDSGYRPPDLALALGRTLADLYDEVQRQAQSLPQEEQEARLREARRALLEPARDLLRRHLPKEEEGRAYLDALLQHLQGQEEKAIARAQAALAESPGLFEAKRLEAEARMALAQARRQGGDLTGTRAELEAAGGALAEALDLARSEPSLWRLEADRRAALAELRVARAPFREVEVGYQASIAACEQALRTDPDDVGALQRAGRAWHDLATQQLDQGIDNRPALQRARGCFERAIQARPKDGELWFWRARVDYALARVIDLRGEPALEAYGHALEAYDRAQANGRESSERAALALLFKAQCEAAHGTDPAASLNRAEALARQARKVREDKFSLNTLGLVLNAQGRARMARGEDPRPLLKEAGDCFTLGHARYHAFASLRNLADRFLLEAQWMRHAGGDAEGPIQEGLRAVDSALQAGPTWFLSHLTRGRLLALRCRLALDRGEAPDGEAARQAFRRAESLNPKDPEAPMDLAALELALGGPQARARAAQALARARRWAPPQATWWARSAACAANPVEAQRDLAKALALNPRSAEALALRARLAPAGEREGILAQARRIDALAEEILSGATPQSR